MGVGNESTPQLGNWLHVINIKPMPVCGGKNDIRYHTNIVADMAFCSSMPWMSPPTLLVHSLLRSDNFMWVELNSELLKAYFFYRKYDSHSSATRNTIIIY